MPGIGILRLRLRRDLVPMSPEVAARRLHLDDVGAEVGQDYGGTGARDEAGQVHHLQSRENIVVCHGFLLNDRARGFSSPPAELGRALLEEGGRALLLVLGGSAEAEIGSFEQQAFALARVQSVVRCLEREFDGDRSVRSDLLQNGLGARDQISRWNDFVDQPDTISFLRADHLSGQNELQGAALADQPRQPLRSAAARNEPERHFWLPEPRGLDREPDGASHRRLATAAECKAIDGRDHRLAEVLDEIEDFLSETAGLLGFERGDMGELADVGAGDERLVAGSRQNGAAYRSVVARILEGRSQILPGRRIQRVKYVGPIDGDVSNAAFLLVNDVREG